MRLNRGGTGRSRPRIQFDHVQVAVDSLDKAADDFASRYGLLGHPGGRHPGRGTGNWIIPLGESYLELITVLDDAEAVKFPTSSRVRRALDERRSFAAWAVRTEDLEASLASFAAPGSPPASLEIVEGRRRRPDGQELTWRSAELVPDGEFSVLPFVIEWQASAELYPGAAPPSHPSGARGFTSIVVSDPQPERARLGLEHLLANDFQYSVEQGPSGVLEVVLDAPNGPLRIR